jgi:hypothetical protein
MPRPELEQQWHDVASEVLSGFHTWRTQHPTATLSELEDALDSRWAVARARLLEDAALASAAADWPRRGVRPVCPHCGAAMHSDGREARRLTTTGEQTLTLRRTRARCPACGTGLFPPG